MPKRINARLKTSRSKKTKKRLATKHARNAVRDAKKKK